MSSPAGTAGTGELLLAADPAAAAGSQLSAFVRHCEATLGLAFADDLAFAAWAERDYPAFWRAFVDWAGVGLGGSLEPAVQGDEVATATFFPGATLNVAAELLAPGVAGDDRVAVIAAAETGRRVALTRGELRDRVGRLARALGALGVGAGDRVVALARNGEEPIVAALATMVVGGAWSAVAPDLGHDAIVQRFSQLAPSVLFVHTAAQVHGAARSLRDRVEALAAALPTLRAVVLMDAAGDEAPAVAVPLHRLSTLLHDSAPWPRAEWPRHPFNQPLYILFSSGTTGRPKCIVHGAGGTLLEHLKEHRLHGDLRAEDVMLFQTTCGWMMWHWQLSALAVGSTIVTYDGSVSFPEPDALLRVAAREGVTCFGTSAAYLQYCHDAGLHPRETPGLPALRAILSTGSILYPHQFRWVMEHFPAVPIQSISGGTDIIGCFVLGHPHRPVHAGDSQSVSLALSVRAWDGTAAQRTGTGELVCIRPFPSRPLGLWGDADGSAFRTAYFQGAGGAWVHGDRIHLSEDGRARILGRSDGTLNVRGVRIGPAELYQVVLQLPEVAEAMAVEQRAPREPGGSRLVLLLVMAPGVTLDRPLTLRIKKELSQRASPNHVPAVIAAVSALPMTLNGKRSETAARAALNGEPVPNREALANAGVLDELRRCADLQAAHAPPGSAT